MSPAEENNQELSPSAASQSRLNHEVIVTPPTNEASPDKQSDEQPALSYQTQISGSPAGSTDNQPLLPQPTVSVPQQPLASPIDNTPIVTVPPPVSNKALIKEHKRRRRLLPALILVLIGVFGGSVAAYFGYYLPNQPSRIWQSALGNTAKGYDQLVAYATSQQDAHYKGLSETGTFKTVLGTTTVDGTLNGSNYGLNSITTGKITMGVAQVSFEARTIGTPSSINPDFYIQIKGIKGLSALRGLSAFGINTDSLDSQWIKVDHTLFDTLESQARSTVKKPTIKGQDIIDAIKAVGMVSKQYVFSVDPNKAVLIVNQNVGKETQDNRSVYHYKVGFNKANTKTYLTNICDALTKSQLGQWAQAQNGASISKTIDCAGMQKAADNIKTTDTADVWVDMQTKLIHKVRFSQTNDPLNNYFDLGLNYIGGNQYPFISGMIDRSAIGSC